MQPLPSHSCSHFCGQVIITGGSVDFAFWRRNRVTSDARDHRGIGCCQVQGRLGIAATAFLHEHHQMPPSILLNFEDRHPSRHVPQAHVACGAVLARISSVFVPKGRDPGGVARIECVEPLLEYLKDGTVRRWRGGGYERRKQEEHDGGSDVAHIRVRARSCPGCVAPRVLDRHRERRPGNRPERSGSRVGRRLACRRVARAPRRSPPSGYRRS